MTSALVCGLAATVAGSSIARTFALGGTTRPLFAVGVLTAVPPLVIAWLVAGPHAPRMLAAAAAMTLGIAAIPIASSGATPSAARLEQIADGLNLPGRIERNRTLGNGRCRDACSEVRRVTLVEDIAFAKFVGQLHGVLYAKHYTVKEYAHHQGEPLRIDASKGKVLAQFEIRFIDLGKTRVASIFIADGPEPTHRVG